MGITELVELVRAGLDRDAADIEQAWQERGFNSERLTTMQGTTVLMSGWRAHREVAAKRQLLDMALSWPHAVDDTGWCDCDQLVPAVCTCGRDERVLAVLQALATPYQDGGHD